MTMKELERKRVSYLDENYGFDYTLEVRTNAEFTEVVSSMGGDVTTHRIYGSCDADFRITCR